MVKIDNKLYLSLANCIGTIDVFIMNCNVNCFNLLNILLTEVAHLPFYSGNCLRGV